MGADGCGSDRDGRANRYIQLRVIIASTDNRPELSTPDRVTELSCPHIDAVHRPRKVIEQGGALKELNRSKSLSRAVSAGLNRSRIEEGASDRYDRGDENHVDRRSRFAGQK